MHSYVIFNPNQEKNLLGCKKVDNSNNLNCLSYLQQVLKKFIDKRSCRHALIGSIQQNESKCADHCPGFGLDLCNGFSAVDTFSAPSPSKI